MEFQVGDIIRVLPRKELSEKWREHFDGALEDLPEGEDYISDLCGQTATIKGFDDFRGDGIRFIHTEENIEHNHWAIYEWEVILVKGVDLSPIGDFTALFEG